jgi:hypothetical protein
MNTTQDIAIDFAQRAVSAINGQLAVEIQRNGFSMDKVRRGRQKIERFVKTSETDPRYKLETFSISGRKIPERIIMAVKWSPKGFHIERNSDSIANGIKASPKTFLIKKDAPLISVENLTAEEIEIEARASAYEAEALAEAATRAGIILKKC